MFTSVLFCALTVLATEDNTQSVLVQTPTVASTQEASAAAVVSTPVPQFVCENGTCRRVVNVEEQAYETHRRRLFGGHVTRKGTRTVYKTSRR